MTALGTTMKRRLGIEASNFKRVRVSEAVNILPLDRKNLLQDILNTDQIRGIGFCSLSRPLLVCINPLTWIITSLSPLVGLTGFATVRSN